MKQIKNLFLLGSILLGLFFIMNRSETKPLVVLLMGPPGAGKGTHALPLSQHLSLPHISTGDLFRENIRNQTPLGKKAATYIDLGQLVPDELVLDMLFTKVASCKQGYILDGFPRTIAQAEALDKRLHSTHTVVALNFHLPDETIISRITGRIACKNCGRPYHMTYDPPHNLLSCDSCQGPLYQRDDDKEEIVRKRLQVYRAQTEPLIAYYTSQNVLRNIDSDQTKAQVFQNVLEALSSEALLTSI